MNLQNKHMCREKAFLKTFTKTRMAAFQGMHVSPANHSYVWLPRKCDYRTDTQAPEKVIPMCCYASQAKELAELTTYITIYYRSRGKNNTISNDFVITVLTLGATGEKMILPGPNPALVAVCRTLASPTAGKRSSHSTLSGTRFRISIHMSRVWGSIL